IPGSSLRLARSPVAPNRTITWSPGRSGAAGRAAGVRAVTVTLPRLTDGRGRRRGSRRAQAHMLTGKPMAARTESGASYDPLALDAIEHRFWREVWESVPAAAAAAHGIELARFGPVQATVIAELAAVRMVNLVLGATAPGAVDGG